MCVNDSDIMKYEKVEFDRRVCEQKEVELQHQRMKAACGVIDASRGMSSCLGK